MKNFLSSLLATIIGILVMTLIAVLILVGIIAASTSQEIPQVTENSLLVARFSAPIADRADNNPFTRFMTFPPMDDMMGLNQILEDLDKAERDENIRGIFLKLSGVSAGTATLTEIRDALLEFRESGKFIYAFADIYTHKSYYLASVADSVFMTPEGMFIFNGLSAEISFYKRALDKLGVEVQVIKHGSYKSAAEPFINEKLSDFNREQIEGYVGALWDKMIADISDSREIPVEKLNQIADELSSIENQTLVDVGMIDGLIYYDEMLSLMKEKLGVNEEDDLDAISLSNYKNVPVKSKKEYTRDKVAVVYAMGPVIDGNAGEGSIGSERIAKAIRKARRDKNVKAIVLRVNSGGGSAIASDVISRESKLAADEKVFVVSMGNVAASGGYYISAPADTIIASEATITGSIGVVGVFPSFKELMNDKLGITSDVVKTNRHADIFSMMDPLDPDEEAFIQQAVDQTYTTFVELVSESRGKTYDEVDAIAGGRVWAGSEALSIGLIDMIGGLEKSISVAAGMAGMDNYRVDNLPKLEDPLTTLMREISGSSVRWKNRIIRKELGDQYVHYRKLNELREMSGIQAIIPFELEVK